MTGLQAMMETIAAAKKRTVLKKQKPGRPMSRASSRRPIPIANRATCALNSSETYRHQIGFALALKLCLTLWIVSLVNYF